MTETTKTLSVLFVCSKNGGKSQLAAGLRRDLAGNAVAVYLGFGSAVLYGIRSSGPQAGVVSGCRPGVLG